MILLTTGCDQFQGLIGKKNSIASVPERTEYKIGKTGIELEFIKNIPPSEVLEESSIQVGVKVHNNGAYKVRDGKLALHRLNPKLLVEEPGELLVNVPILDIYKQELEGKSKFNPEGAFYNAFFNLKAGKIALEKRYEDVQFTVIACYKYNTEASVDICINPNIFDAETIVEKVCDANQKHSLSAGQGAPIEVTSVDQKTTKSIGDRIKTTFEIEINNVGGGMVKSYDSYAKSCGGTTSVDDVSKLVDTDAVVILKDISFSRYTKGDMDCSPKDTLQMKKGEKNKIVCSIDVEKEQSAYTTPLKIELEYGYVNQKTGSVKIMQMPK